MATRAQMKTFQSEVVGDEFLETLLSWVRENLAPEEVFDEEELRDWATENDLIDADDEEVMADWTAENGYIADDDDDRLAEWATDNGYIMQDECPECDREHVED